MASRPLGSLRLGQSSSVSLACLAAECATANARLSSWSYCSYALLNASRNAFFWWCVYWSTSSLGQVADLVVRHRYRLLKSVAACVPRDQLGGLLPEPGDMRDVVDRVEAAAELTVSVIDDPARSFRADAEDAVQRLGVGAIEVDGSVLSAAMPSLLVLT